ncbi:MAG: hypothetical protein D4S02_12450 [Rhodocyclaceae bacterium]|nr:MAG: hypothetical protein D4S02_12450 [Rhodocyclaceae bacterium]
MFDSPIDYCPVCKEMVLLDQTHRECAAEHHCRKSVVCPLKACFSGYDFSSPKPVRHTIPDESHH